MTEEEWQSIVDIHTDYINEFRNKPYSEVTARQKEFLAQAVEAFAQMKQERLEGNNEEPKMTEEQNIFEELDELAEAVQSYLISVPDMENEMLLATTTAEIGEKMQALGMRFIATAIQMANDLAQKHATKH